MSRVSAAAASVPGRVIARAAVVLAGTVLVISTSAYSSQPVVLVSSTVGDCSLSAEYDEEWRTLRLRPHHPESRNCAIDRDSMLGLLRSALALKEPPPPADGYKTLYVGRLVDYPWMSRYLATAASRDPGWNSKNGRPVGGDINGYVDGLLLRTELTGQMTPVLEEAGYVITAVTVEKVLVGSVGDLSGRLPFDAQVWFRVERR